MKVSLSNRLPDQEIDHHLALKQTQTVRKQNLIKDDTAQLQQELDFWEHIVLRP